MWLSVSEQIVVPQFTMSRLDPKRRLGNFSPEWTFLDIPERPWMVGRVATKLGT